MWNHGLPSLNDDDSWWDMPVPRRLWSDDYLPSLTRNQSWERAHPVPRLRNRRDASDRWTRVIDMSGFEPDDVRIKIDGHGVIVHGKHEVLDGDHIDRMERRRKVMLPSNVDISDVQTSFGSHGQLIIQAPVSMNHTQTRRNQALVDRVDSGCFGNTDIFGSFPRGFQREGDEVKLRLDMSAYTPSEVNINIKDHHVVVHAKHEDRNSFKETKQSVLLPRGMEEDKIKSILTQDGIMVISAPAVSSDDPPRKIRIGEEFLPIDDTSSLGKENTNNS